MTLDDYDYMLWMGLLIKRHKRGEGTYKKEEKEEAFLNDDADVFMDVHCTPDVTKKCYFFREIKKG